MPRKGRIWLTQMSQFKGSSWKSHICCFLLLLVIDMADRQQQRSCCMEHICCFLLMLTADMAEADRERDLRMLLLLEKHVTCTVECLFQAVSSCEVGRVF